MQNKVLLITGRQKIENEPNGWIIVNLKEDVKFSDIAIKSRKIFLERSVQKEKQNMLLRIVTSSMDRFIFTDHNIFYTDLCSLLVAVEKSLNKNLDNCIYYLGPELEKFHDVMKFYFGSLKFEIYREENAYNTGSNIRFNDQKKIMNSKYYLRKLYLRLSYCSDFCRKIEKNSDKIICVQPSKRYEAQAILYLHKRLDKKKHYIFDWNDEQMLGHNYCNKINTFKLIFSIKVFMVFLMIVIFYQRRLANDLLVKTYLKSQNSRIKYLSNVNLAILYVCCKSILDKTKQDDEILFFGTVDLISRSFDVCFRNLCKRVFVKQNIQAATVEPAFVDFEEVIVGDDVTADIFEQFRIKTEVKPEVCSSANIVRKLKEDINISSDRSFLLYVDESLPTNAIEHEARLNVLGLLNIINTSGKVLPIHIRLHPTVDYQNFGLINTSFVFSNNTFEHDLASAAIVIGRQSSSLCLSILAGIHTVVIDPSRSSFFRSTRPYYTFNNSHWFDDLSTFEQHLLHVANVM